MAMTVVLGRRGSGSRGGRGVPVAAAAAAAEETTEDGEEDGEEHEAEETTTGKYDRVSLRSSLLVDSCHIHFRVLAMPSFSITEKPPPEPLFRRNRTRPVS